MGGDAEHLHERYIRHINEALAGPARGHGGHHAHVPRQLPLLVGGRGRLRLRRRGAVQRARRRRLLPGVRRRALGRLRAAALRAARASWSCSAWSPPSAASSRARTSSSAASRRRRSTSTLDQLCLSPQCGFSSTVEGNDAHRRRAGAPSCGSIVETAARGLGLAERVPAQFGRPALGRWRAGPVAGHGLRLRRLRLRGVSRATRPNTVFARPGSTVHVAVRERDCLRGRSSCAGLGASALSAGVSPPLWSASASASHRVRSRSPRKPTRHRRTPRLATTAAPPIRPAGLASWSTGPRWA